MKTLNHHVLIFDQNCPLCRAYTNTFIQTGMLDAKGRSAFTQLDAPTCELLDMQRARNEIALVNTKTGQVVYGIDSLFRVIGHAMPVFAPLFRWTAFRLAMKELYAFISYNRKVIIPSPVSRDTCVPDFNWKYRWFYLIFCWLLTSLVLTNYSSHLNGLVPVSGFYREFLVCGGQVLFQSLVLAVLNREKIMSYLGNMMTISLAGALLLLLTKGVLSIFEVVDPRIYAAFFLLVAGLMFLEHWRRMKLLGISWFASVSWVLYRVLILLLIF